MPEKWDLDFPPYDLKQDLVMVEIGSLQKIAMTYVSASLFKREDIREETRQNWDVVIKSNMIYNERKEWKTLVKKVEKIFLSKFDPPTNKIKKQISSMNTFIGNQIHKFFYKDVSSKEIDLFLRNFVFTHQGTINTYITIIRILDKDDLTLEFKFTLACKYFIEAKVIKYLSELSESVQHWFKKLKILKQYSCVALFYWSHKIKGKTLKIEIDAMVNPGPRVDTTLSSLLVNKSVYDKYPEAYLLRWAITTKNDCAVRYLWRNLVSHCEGSIEILSELCKEIAKFGNQNIFMFLLQENVEKSTEWYVFHSSDILKLLFMDSRWRNSHLITFVDYLETRVHFNGYETIKKIISQIHQNTNTNQELDEYWKILGCCMLYIKTDNFINNVQLYDIVLENASEILIHVINKKDSPIMQKVCEVIKIKKFGIGFLQCIKSLFNKAVLKKDFYLIDSVFINCSNSEDDYKNLRDKFSDENAFEICEFLITNNEWEILDKFMDWFSDYYSNNKANTLKSSAPFHSDATLIRELISKGIGLPYTKYSSNTSLSLNVKMNEEIEKPTSDEKEYDSLFLSLDRLLNWSLESEDKINNFKRLFFQIPVDCPGVPDNETISHIYNFLVQLVNEGQYKILDDLIIWSRCDMKDIEAFKKRLPKDAKKMEDFGKVNNLLGFFKYIEWCEKLDYQI